MPPGLANVAQRHHSAVWKATFVQNSHFENCLYLYGLLCMWGRYCQVAFQGMLDDFYQMCSETRCGRQNLSLSICWLIKCIFFLFFILNIIPEAELCKHIKEATCQLSETLLLKCRNVREEFREKCFHSKKYKYLFIKNNMNLCIANLFFFFPEEVSWDFRFSGNIGNYEVKT